ncbi:MAG: DJ-1/PfpI family protein [Clostridia bacterium]|nr:DJ-1/PfpI family protein [Clostridia bacterium]
MKKIAVLISDGTEEIEVITPIDLLRRAGVQCDVFSVCGKQITGSHQIKIEADMLVDELIEKDYDGIVIPGGMPGAKIISNNQTAVNVIRAMAKEGKLVSAICASPAVVLSKRGVIDGKKATCYPFVDFTEQLKSTSDYIEQDVVIDGNVITANGPKSAMKFALAICDYLGVEPKF